jgi:hypothetical protein
MQQLKEQIKLYDEAVDALQADLEASERECAHYRKMLKKLEKASSSPSALKRIFASMNPNEPMVDTTPCKKTLDYTEKEPVLIPVESVMGLFESHFLEFKTPNRLFNLGKSTAETNFGQKVCFCAV